MQSGTQNKSGVLHTLREREVGSLSTQGARRSRVLSLVWWGIVLVSGMVSGVSASHRPSLSWMEGLRGNGFCCRDFDCTEATIAVLDQGSGQTLVLIGEHRLTLPSSWVHPTQNGRGYWCFRSQGQTYRDHDGILRAVPPDIPTKRNTRCVFYFSSG